jgi:hypothetical protein
VEFPRKGFFRAFLITRQLPQRWDDDDRQAEEGTAVGEVCRKAGISEATY